MAKQKQNGLTAFTKEELEVELERRKAEVTQKKAPATLLWPDWSLLRDDIQMELELFLQKKIQRGAFEWVVFERTMKTLYGKDFFSEWWYKHGFDSEL